MVSRVLLFFAGFYVRRLLIQHLGNEVNGLNSLYNSIIGVLSMAELGVGSAIVFAMYKPIVDGDSQQVSALYHLYKKLYFIIGIIIFVAGLVMLPFLPCFISDYNFITAGIYLPFYLTLISTFLSYLYSAKISLIQAYKNNYIATIILTVSSLICYILQIITIFLWSSYALYLICHIVETLIIWLITEIVVRKKYEDIIHIHSSIAPSTKREIVKNIKALFMHKVGVVLVNTIDSVIISSFIGVVILGKYSNYTLIVGVITTLLAQFFTPLTSVIGHLCAEDDLKETKKWFHHFYFLNFSLGMIFFLGYYAVIDEVIRICFGPGLEVSKSLSFIITLNQFTMFMRKTTLLFRDASGTFYYDRWKPIVEGLCNLALSLWFVHIFPEDLRIVAVIVATIITTLGICHIVDPYVVYKHLFKQSVKEYYVRNYCYIGVFVVALFVMNQLMREMGNDFVGILVNGSMAVGVSVALMGAVAVFDREYRDEMKRVVRKGMQVVRRGRG